MNEDFEAPPTTHAQSSTSLCSVQPSTDWGGQAVSYFLANFVTGPAGNVPGYLQFLPALIYDQPAARCLQDSLRAVAMTSLANVSGGSDLHLKANQLYGKALRSTQTAVLSSAKLDDAVLLASVFLLQKREASLYYSF